MAVRFFTDTFTDEQLDQIEKVHNAVANLLVTLLVKPDYLKDENLTGCRLNQLENIHLSEIADLVCDHILLNKGYSGNIFYPTHFEGDNKYHHAEYVSDCFNEDEYHDEKGDKNNEHD